MKYIIHTTFNKKAICGEVNLPVGTECELEGNMILYDNKPLCLATSQIGHDFFTQNADGQGLLRGKLVTDIKDCLSKRDDNYQTRWDKIWEDEACQKYKRKEHADFWLWNHEFFNAPIEDLKYISNLIDIKGE